MCSNIEDKPLTTNYYAAYTFSNEQEIGEAIKHFENKYGFSTYTVVCDEATKVLVDEIVKTLAGERHLMFNFGGKMPPNHIRMGPVKRKKFTSG